MLILLVMLLFGMDHLPTAPKPDHAKLLIEVWDVKEELEASALPSPQENTNDPHLSWEAWALASARDRTILGFHHIEWVWSILHDYPVLTCFKIGPLAAPGPGCLWKAPSEQEWHRLYAAWAWRWRDGVFRMAEFFSIDPGDLLAPRAERWLAEADEFGVMLMAEGEILLFKTTLVRC